MIIDDEYKGMKDKYFEQAQTQIGAVSGVVTVLNDFVKKYDDAKRKMQDDKNYIDKTYLHDSAKYDQRHMEIFDTFNAAVDTIRTDAIEQVHEKVQQVHDKISAVIGASIPDGAMDDIMMIRSFSGKLSDDEAKVFLNKYQNSYLVTKTIFDALCEGQSERIGMKFISTDEISEGLKDIENTSVNFIRNYNGALSYDFAIMLGGVSTKVVNDAFESFISVYGR